MVILFVISRFFICFFEEELPFLEFQGLNLSVIHCKKSTYDWIISFGIFGRLFGDNFRA